MSWLTAFYIKIRVSIGINISNIKYILFNDKNMIIV